MYPATCILGGYSRLGVKGVGLAATHKTNHLKSIPSLNRSLTPSSLAHNLPISLHRHPGWVNLQKCE